MKCYHCGGAAPDGPRLPGQAVRCDRCAEGMVADFSTLFAEHHGVSAGDARVAAVHLAMLDWRAISTFNGLGPIVPCPWCQHLQPVEPVDLGTLIWHFREDYRRGLTGPGRLPVLSSALWRDCFDPGCGRPFWVYVREVMARAGHDAAQLRTTCDQAGLMRRMRRRLEASTWGPPPSLFQVLASLVQGGTRDR